MRIPVTHFLLILCFAFCVPGMAQPGDLLVDTTSGHVLVPSDPSLTPPHGLTVEAWVYYDPNHPISVDYPTVVRKAPSGQHPYILRITLPTQIVQFGVWTDTSYTGFDSTVPIAAYTWTHLAGTWDGTTMHIYINGVQVGTQAKSGTMIQNSTADLNIGAGTGGTVDDWNGRLDEVRIWDHARTPAELAANMFIQVDNAPGLVSAWHFNGDLVDDTGGNDGVAVGNSSIVSSLSPVDPLQLVAARISPVGAALTFRMRGALPNAPYFLDNSFSGAMVGTPLVAPLVGVFPLDGPLLNLTFGAFAPGIFVDYLGYTDASGEASAVFNVPAWSHLVGMDLSSAFLYLTQLNPMVLGAISPVVTTTFVGALPVIQAVAPSSGSLLGQQSVAVSGQNFSPAATVLFGTKAATNVVVHSSSLITCTTPYGTTVGPIDVTVTDPLEPAAVAEDAYTYNAILNLNSVSPVYASAGTTVTINAFGIQAGATVTVADIPATVLTQTVSSLDFQMPAGAGCHAPVVLTNPDGQSDAVVMNPGPTISGTYGASGPAAGGASFLIFGQGFGAGTQVTVGGATAVLNSVSATLIDAVAPPGTPGTVPIVVTTADGCTATTSYVFL